MSFVSYITVVSHMPHVSCMMSIRHMSFVSYVMVVSYI